MRNEEVARKLVKIAKELTARAEIGVASRIDKATRHLIEAKKVFERTEAPDWVIYG